MDWLGLLIAINDVLTASIGATAFALQLYLFFYNRKSRVARGFNGLLVCVILVYLTDLLLRGNQNPYLMEQLLRWQWLGIAFTPTLYLEFTRAIQLSVRQERFPRWPRLLGLVISGIVTILALTTNLVVYDGELSAGAYYLRPGPLFYPFAILFALTTLWGLRETLRARDRCHTRAARRRMTYLSIGFLAPALGVFPYLLIIGWPSRLPDTLLWILLIIGNLAIAGMMFLMAYSIAFIGALTPDRVVKHRLVRFLLRGPIAALLALVAFGVGLTIERSLYLGRYTLSLVAVAVTVILSQLVVELGKPLLDLMLYREGREEVERVQELSQRLLTTADLRQFLENILAAICELLQSVGGFIAVLENGQLHREIWCGLHVSSEEVAEFPLPDQVQTHEQDGILLWNDYWILPIHDKSGEVLLGLVGLRDPQARLPLHETRLTLLQQLLVQAGAALDDRRLQQIVFQVFSPLLSELEDIQRRRGLLHYNGATMATFSPVNVDDMPQWIHDALSHYWGGPRLTENPMLEFKVVQQAAAAHDGSPIKGLRAVLTEAIEQLRPDGERKLTAPEWLLYNILEMKFIRGHKVREVAMRLALSESDFYRKQRVAIENLATIIAEMESSARESGTPPTTASREQPETQ
ncbi:MAG: hypothetical protein JXB35_02670 [Anaerolineae bacterium]|nr:hypothetical protein [Anaerolineae bacterium]